MFSQWWSTIKIISNIAEISKKLNFHDGFLSYLQDSIASPAHLAAIFCPVLGLPTIVHCENEVSCIFCNPLQKQNSEGASSNGVGIICPLVRIGLTDLPKTIAPLPPAPSPPASLFKTWSVGYGFKPEYIQLCQLIKNDHYIFLNCLMHINWNSHPKLTLVPSLFLHHTG